MFKRVKSFVKEKIESVKAAFAVKYAQVTAVAHSVLDGSVA